MLTRVDLGPLQVEGRVLEDRRGTQVQARREGAIWALRPVEPFDLRGERNEAIRVKQLVVDLVASPDPVREWREPRGGGARFNYGAQPGVRLGRLGR